MVGLLWAEGRVDDVMALEALWEDLGGTVPLALLCGYPAEDPRDVPDGARGQVCSVHSTVLMGPSEAEEGGGPVDRVSQRFQPTADAPRAARQLLRATLARWGLDDLAEDAALVVTELATNATLHAGSPFELVLEREGSSLRLSVRDSSPVTPDPRSPGGRQQSGRGLRLVEALARRWGTDLQPDGKVVWAELTV